ncbi:MAG: helix-turn-helix transcriptional regulator [Planctomycetota bacterium]|nr:helix-turn-helix transcriptional regulator [Planctomycetota bacterium]
MSTITTMAKTIEAIRKAINASPMSRYRLAKESGVTEAAISRLMSGERAVNVDSLEKLADALGLAITIGPKKKEGR